MSDHQNDIDFVRQQLLRYAEDLSQTYRAEQEKSRQLEESNRALRSTKDELEAALGRLQTTHAELEDAYQDTIQRLAIAAEYRDDDTGDHILRMASYTGLLGRYLGLPDEEVRSLLYAAPMHDVGKIGIPDAVLLKPGKLTSDEFELMKRHTVIGAGILDNPRGDVLHVARTIALTHHERWDGRGYPHGLAGTEIPMSGRVTALADVFDALTSERPYKSAWSVERAAEVIGEERGLHFDPEVTDTFLAHLDSFVAVKEEIAQRPDLSLSLLLTTREIAFDERTPLPFVRA